MPNFRNDFTMCVNNKCGLAKDCERHRKNGTKPVDHQSYSKYYPNDDGECDYYLENWDK